jgi:hypothetical protein
MAIHETLTEVNHLLFCEECNRRALDFLEAATSAVRMAGIEPPAVTQLNVEESLHSFLSLHERCLSCNQRASFNIGLPAEAPGTTP